jgi:predicted metal-binding membrane protein
MPITAELSRGPRWTRRFGELAAWHPEWWIIAMSAVAWLVIGLSTRVSFVPAICSSGSLTTIGRSIARLRVRPISSQFPFEYVGWLMMTVAMMLPLIILPVRHVAFRSFSWRRNRAIAGFLCGYLGVWACAGAILVPVLIAVRRLDPSGGPMALRAALICAALWQLTPWKLRALRGCHRTVALSASGWRADADCVRYGAGTGSSCALSCWALMAAPALASPSLIAMLCVQGIALYERYEPAARSKFILPVVLAAVAMLSSFALVAT